MKRRIAVFSVDYFPYIGGAEVAVKEDGRMAPWSVLAKPPEPRLEARVRAAHLVELDEHPVA